MKYEIRYKPAFATAFMTIKPGESLIAEAGAMASMDGALTMTTQLSGGLFPALMRRFFGGESLFVNVFKNPTSQPLNLVLTQSTIGDIEVLALKAGETLCLQPGAYIASTSSVKLGVQWAGWSSLFAGEGLFRLKATGSGLLLFGAYGGIQTHQVNGEFIVDSGHLVAYSPQLKMKIGLAGGLLGSVTSGEGLVNRLSGTGTIYLQSRSVDGLVRYLRSKLR